MLTKQDLTAIRGIVKEEVKTIVKDEVKSAVQHEVKTIVRQEVDNALRQELTPIKKDIKKIKSDIDIIVRSFDQDYVLLRHRVDRIEDHLQLAPL